MSAKHPVVAVTGSSGAGTTTVMKSFENIFRREKIRAAVIEGDSFHRFDRLSMRAEMKSHEARGEINFSHFGPEANLLDELAASFKQYGETGRCKVRKYLHDAGEAAPHNQAPGTFTPWVDSDAGTDMLFYEGLHGAYVSDTTDVARYVDLLIGVVPIINLEWIQKLHRDKSIRGYSHEAVVDVILRRMPDYVTYICPQFSRTHINFQRVPTVDTSNPFVARDIPSSDESLVIIRFTDAHGIDFPYLLSMLEGSWMTRPNSICVPGAKMGLALQLILTPMILRLKDVRRRT
jgi:phosphoribulokinase